MSLGRKIKQMIGEFGAVETVEKVARLIEDRSIPKYALSLKDMAENIVGPNWETRLKNLNGVRVRESFGGDSDLTMRVMESGAGDAVDASAFADITGQLLINEVRQKFQNPAFIGDMLCETIPITNGNLGTQITPWHSNVLSVGETVQAGMPYPHTKFVQQYVRYPAPVKKGEICAVTMEMIFSDLTSQALDSAGSVGLALGYSREQSIAQVVLGGVNNFYFGNADVALTNYNTYDHNSSGYPYINRIPDEQLVDWTNVNNLEQLFVNMTDPATGRRIFVEPKMMLVMPKLKYTAKRIVHATETRSGDITTGVGTQTLASNPLDTTYNVVAGSVFWEQQQLIDTDTAEDFTHWYLIDPFAFIWRQVYGLRTESAPRGNPMEFNQDIAVQVKAGYYGVAAVRSPWHVAQGYLD